MTWTRQVLHVARKDLLHAKWLFVIYAAGLAYAAYQAFDPVRRGGIWPMFLMMALLAAIVVTLVHADSPAVPNAFWTTRPLDPVAVAVAKVVAMAVGAGIPALIAQGIVLSRFGLSAKELLAALGVSAIAFVAAVGLSFFLASLTKTTGEFVLALIGLLFLSQIIGSAAMEMRIHAPWAIEEILGGVVLALCLLAVYKQYKTRRLSLGRRIGATAVASMFANSFVSDSAFPPWAGEPVALSGRAEQHVHDDKVAVALRFPAGRSDSSVRITGALTQADIGGRRVSVNKARIHHEPRLTGVPGLKWLDQMPYQDSVWARLTLAKDGNVEPRAIRAAGYFEIERQEIIGTTPLIHGATIRADGFRMEVTSVQPGTIELRRAWISLAKRGSVFEPEHIQYALINRLRGEAVTLKPGSGYSNPLPMPILGLNTSNGRDTFSLGDRPRQVWVNSDWMNDAEVVAIRWRPLEKIAVTVAIPATAIK